MNEEEIIKILNEYIESPYKCDTCKYCSGKRNTQQAINGLLNLYQAEKEKNKELTDLVETIQEFKRLNKPVMEIVHEMEKFEDEFISKDKIKEKIEKYENKLHSGKFISQDYIEMKIYALKELLEE